MSEYVGGQPQQADGGAAVQSLDLRTANLSQELAQLLAASMGGKPTPSATATASQFNTLQALVSTATQTQRAHQLPPQQRERDSLSSLSYTRPAQPVAPPPVSPVQVAPEPSLVSPPPGGYVAPASDFAPAPSYVPPAASYAPASSYAPAPSYVPAAAYPPASAFPAPTPAPFMPAMAASVGNGLLVAEPHDDEPMPIPSTWRQTTTGDDDKWYRQQLGAAGLGLLAGLVVVVPAVLWLSGFLGGGSQAKTRQAEAPSFKVAAVTPVKVASAGTATVEPRIVATPPPAPMPSAETPDSAPAPQSRSLTVETPMAMVAPPTPKPVEPPRSRADDLFTQAKRRIEEYKDVPGARDLLQQAPETSTAAALTFLLAETYDPNMLASWQTKGVTANPERARVLYQRARELGDARAQQRLDWLTAN